MFRRELHAQSQPIEMIGAGQKKKSRNFIVRAGNLAFRLFTEVQDDNAQVRFADITYGSYDRALTSDDEDTAITQLFDALGADPERKGYRLQQGQKIVVGRAAGIRVLSRQGRTLQGALPESASELVMRDKGLAPVHFEVTLPQPHIAVVTDKSREPGTTLEERYWPDNPDEQ